MPQNNAMFQLQLEEIGGLFYIFAQEYFNALKERTGIELENVVYFRDETHYFVMTAKKSSLLKRQVLKQVACTNLYITHVQMKHKLEMSILHDLKTSYLKYNNRSLTGCPERYL